MTLTKEKKDYIKDVVFDQEGFYTVEDLATRINQEEWMQEVSHDEMIKEVKKHEIARLQAA